METPVADHVRDPLVDAFVAAAQQTEVAAGQLGRQRVVELAPLGSELDDAARLADARRVGPEHGLERRAHHVDAQDHAGAATVRGVVHLGVLERRVVTVVPDAQVVAQAAGPLRRAPGPDTSEGLGKQGEDIDPHRPCQLELTADPP